MSNNTVFIVVEDAPAVVAPNEDHDEAHENNIIMPVAGMNAHDAMALHAAFNHPTPMPMPTFAQPSHGTMVELNAATFLDEMEEYEMISHEWQAFVHRHLEVPVGAVGDAEMAFAPFGGPNDAQMDTATDNSDSESEEEDASSTAAQSDASDEDEGGEYA